MYIIKRGQECIWLYRKTPHTNKLRISNDGSACFHQISVTIKTNELSHSINSEEFQQ